MSGAPTIAELFVSADPDQWRAIGFTVDDDGCVVIGTVTLRIATDAEAAGIGRWSLRGVAATDIPDAGIDGLPTTSARAELPDAPAHQNGIVAIDHLVVLTPDLDRTIDALAMVGLELRRIREGPAGDGRPVRQAFFRMNEVILEVVATKGDDDEPARFWGLTFTSDDLDATLAFFGERASDARAAVQPGRRIATVRAPGLGLPVAVMDR